MKKLILVLLLCLLVVPAFVVVAQDEAIVTRLEEYNSSLPKGYGVVSVEDFNVMLAEKPLVLLDVRQPEEYAAGHIEGSFNVPIRELGDNLNLLPDLNADIVVICKGGARAMYAMTALNLLGYQNAKTLKGGFDAWAAAELPTTTEAFVPEIGTAPEFDPVLFEAVDTFLTTLPEGYALVSPQNLAVELAEKPVILIDVRGEEEWATGYIEGAQHLWINEFMSRRAEWPADMDAEIVIYCGSGYRGGMAALMMELMGYSNVRNLSGGSTAWTTAELPLVGVPGTTAAEFQLDEYLVVYVGALPNTFNAVRATDLAEELKANPELLLVDVRTPEEYAEGFIEGAVNIPLQELPQHLDMLPNLDQNIVIYCGSGHRSALAMTALNLLGYKNVRSMVGGFSSWTSAGLTVSQTPVEYVGGAAPEFDPAVLDVVNNFLTTIPAGYYTVKAADLSVELIDNPPFVIDVRTDSEWDEGHIEGSVHIALRDFMAQQALWPQDLTAPIVIYDNPTHRSSMALAFMRLMGYENVRVLGGGTTAWTSAQLPLVTE